MFLVLLTPLGRASAVWNKTYEGTGYPTIGFIQTSDEGYAIIGHPANATIDEKYDDFFLTKTDSTGNTQWSKTYSRSNEDRPNTVIQTKDGGYALLGYTSESPRKHNIWLIKVDSSGLLEWNTTFVNGLVGNALIQTSDGGYVITGWGMNGFLFIKTDNFGNYQLYEILGNTINTDGDGNVLCNTAYSIAQTNEGGYIIAGAGQSQNDASNTDVWLIKIDSNAELVWKKEFGGLAYDCAYTVIQTKDGGYALLGYTSSYGAGKKDVWLIKTDSSGNIEWDETFGGSNDDWGSSLVQNDDGGYTLLGNTRSFEVGGQDYWLIKVDSSGKELWKKTYGGTKDEGAGALVSTSDGGYALAGYSDSFGYGQKNFWVVKTDEEGLTSEFPDEIQSPLSQDPITDIPLWAFNGAFATYETTIEGSNLNIGLTITMTIDNVNVQGKICDFAISNNGSISSLSFSERSVPFNQPTLFAIGVSDLAKLNNGQAFQDYSGSAQIIPKVVISVPSGTYLTDEVIITGSSVANGSMWMDMYSGLMVKASAGFQLKGIVTSSEIQLVETNIYSNTTAHTITFEEGEATFDDSAFTGVRVEISDPSASNALSVEVISTNFGTKLPPQPTVIQVDGLIFYDVQVIQTTSLSQEALATIYLTNLAFREGNVASYWDGNSWVQCTSSFSAPHTVITTIHVSELTGTLIKVSSNNADFFGSSLLNQIVIVVLFVILFVAIGAVVFLRRRGKKRST